MGFFNPKDGASTAESAESPWSGETNAAYDEAMAALSKAGKGKRARPTKSEVPPVGSSVPSEMAGQIQKLFNPEAWKPLCKAPFQLAEAYTGRKCVQVTEGELETLAVTTAMTAEYTLPTNPAYVAIALCAINWFAIGSAKYIANALEKRKELELQQRVNGNGNASHN